MKRKHIFYFLALFCLVSIVAGCDNPCRDVACVNGACEDGTCICQANYGGDFCDTAFNAKFLGTFLLNESCTISGSAGPYSVSIAPTTDTPDMISMVGLWQVPANIVHGHVSSDGTSFHVERQSLNNTYDIEAGTATLSADRSTINITYKIYASSSGNLVDECTAVLEK